MSKPSASAALASLGGGIRTLRDRAYVAWRSPGRFTKNPDLVRLASGRLLFIYSDNDQHWSQETQILTLVASDDDGKTWRRFTEIARADLRKGDERMVTPRLSLLQDGRLVALIDHDDFGHFHEDQPNGMWMWWSEDGGATWSEPVVPNIPGFEPDRVVELPDGRLAVGTQVLRRDSLEYAEVLCISDDRGKTWRPDATMAHDGYHRMCEGGVVVLERAGGGYDLACVMRENHSNGMPSMVTFSEDGGRTWTHPRMCPFAIHRPYAKQLPDGRVMVTGRHVDGVWGSVAWAGDLRSECGVHRIGGPRTPQLATLTREALVIANADKKPCRYTLLPPESVHSEIVFEARVRIAGGEPGKPVAVMSLSKLAIQRGGTPVLWLGNDFIQLGGTGADTQRKVDLSRARSIALRYTPGWLQVQVDGQTLMNNCVLREEQAHGGGFWLDDPGMRTCFGNSWDGGTSHWESIDYRVRNSTQPDHTWSWRAADGLHPDDYQRRRLVQLHGPAAGEPSCDGGYSSWLVMPQGDIQFVDYSGYGETEGKAHIVGLRFRPDEIPS